jgi:hypothetical protein
MSDVNPQQEGGSTADDRLAATDAERHRSQEHPAQEAHGGSMAPGLVDDTGNRTAEIPPGDLDR